MLTFFLYHLAPHTTVFGRELYYAFKHHPNRTSNHKSADFFITSVSNECNYPNYDMSGCPTVLPFAHFSSHHAFYRLKKPHAVFFHTTPPDLPAGLINIAYTGPGIVIPPPAITTVDFGANARKAQVFFQGTIDRTAARKQIIGSLRKNACVKQKGTKQEYVHHLQTSEYALVVSGDLPWSYRLTEVIQSGAIPLFVKEDNHALPMSDEIDWTKCAEFVSMKQLPSWLPNQTNAAIKRKYLLEIRSRFVSVRKLGDYIVRAISRQLLSV